MPYGKKDLKEELKTLKKITSSATEYKEMAKLMTDMYQSLNMVGKPKETEKPKKIKFNIRPKGSVDETMAKGKTPIPAPRPEYGYFSEPSVITGKKRMTAPSSYKKPTPTPAPRPAHSLPTLKGKPTKVVPRAMTKGEMEVAHMTPKQKERHMNRWASNAKYKYGDYYNVN